MTEHGMGSTDFCVREIGEERNSLGPQTVKLRIDIWGIA